MEAETPYLAIVVHSRKCQCRPCRHRDWLSIHALIPWNVGNASCSGYDLDDSRLLRERVEKFSLLEDHGAIPKTLSLGPSP